MPEDALHETRVAFHCKALNPKPEALIPKP